MRRLAALVEVGDQPVVTSLDVSPDKGAAGGGFSSSFCRPHDDLPLSTSRALRFVQSAKALATMGIQAYAAGLATSMTVSAGNPDLDSHGIADYQHLAQLEVVFDLARHIVNTADAEPKPVPTVVVMTSDFGRTPVREPPGSGHWPVASMMILQNKAAQALNILPAGKVIGGTTGTPEGPNDEQKVLRVRKINPTTHAFDDAGIAISPAHVFRALRRIAGIAEDKALSPFPINIDGGELELAV